MKRPLGVLVTLLVALSGAAVQTSKALNIYTIDVEGGKSMLIDAGWPQSATREASTDVIVQAVKNAGIERIDYLVVSHFDPRGSPAGKVIFK